MRRPKSSNRLFQKQNRLSEVQEIELLESWIDSGKPDSGLNPLSLSSLPTDAPVGRLDDGSFSQYAGCARFRQLPLSQNTSQGLRDSKYVQMTDIQRASLPHALCGRDILGAAKTGSGKTLAFLIPVLEKLYRLRWGPEDGVGCIIISPTRELAGQIFDVLKSVGKHHSFSAGLLIGGRKDVESEKERVNLLNILICTPGRLLQHMDETPNFDCSQLQVLVLDEADRILDAGFKKALNAIISQLPKHRQTLLFSATQTKSVQDLARLSLKDPEYLSVHEESLTATPHKLKQTAMVVPLNEKLDMLWSFIKTHLNSKILVFFSSCKQAKFVFEMFKKLRPGIPLKCLHGRMKQGKRMEIYSEFCEQRSVLFATDVASRGLDFNKGVDWVVQVDCPEDVAAYIHRVGRTARYMSVGKSVLFVMPSEMKMLEKLHASKIPVHLIKVNRKRIQFISGLLAALLVKYPDLKQLAQRAFITYLRSVNIQKDKEVFDVMKLPIDEFSASLGLPMTPKIRFLNQKINNIKNKGKSSIELLDFSIEDPKFKAEMNGRFVQTKEASNDEDPIFKAEVNRGFVQTKEACNGEETNVAAIGDDMPATRLLKKKKLKINIHRPVGTRVVFDEEGNSLPPLAAVAETRSHNVSLQLDIVRGRYERLRDEMKQADREDKSMDRGRLRANRRREKAKLKNAEGQEEDEGESPEEEDGGSKRGRGAKRSKIYFESDSDGGGDDGDGTHDSIKADGVSLEEQEALALKLLSSMHS